MRRKRRALIQFWAASGENPLAAFAFFRCCLKTAF
jgi:hypothetical protein